MMNRNFYFVVIALLSVSLVTLVILVWIGETTYFDNVLHKWALGLNTPNSVSIWKGVSTLGSLAVLGCLTFISIGIFAVRHEWQEVKLIAFAMGGAVLLNNSIKLLVHRPRPEEIFAQTMPSSFSFPSGHALHSFTFYMMLAVVIGRYGTKKTNLGLWFAATLVVALIGASRIFLGVHYGSDVLGGYLIAAIWLMLVMGSISRLDTT